MPQTFMDRFAVRDICDDEVLMNLRLIYCTQEKVGLQTCVLVGTCNNIDRKEFHYRKCKCFFNCVWYPPQQDYILTE